MALVEKGAPVCARGEATPTGKATGGVRCCALEGCLGRRIGVRWSNGRITFPCTKGMRRSEAGVWEIL